MVSCTLPFLGYILNVNDFETGMIWMFQYLCAELGCLLFRILFSVAVGFLW